MESGHQFDHQMQTDEQITSVIIQPSWTRHRLAIWFAYLIFLLIAGVMLLNIVNGTLSAWSVVAPILLLVAFTILFIASIRTNAKWRRYSRDNRSNDPLGFVIRDEVEMRESIWDVDQVPNRLERICSRLVKQGNTSKVYRLAFSPPSSAVLPIRESFEPRIIDECDRSFQELELSLNSSHLDMNDTSPRQYEGGALRSLRRNIVARAGGGLGLIWFGFRLIQECVASMRAGAPTFNLALFGLPFVVILIMLMQSSAESSRQWWLVPGGLLFRFGRMSSTFSQLHVFARHSSLLCLYQRGNWSWIATVADSESTESTTLTRREADMLLRAWLSPLPPPNVKRLADFW
ncbi:MAG: hypothetical protein AABZ08_01650 [Planctomycetota bacterium]|mgnify:CR=1 FL=1